MKNKKVHIKKAILAGWKGTKANLAVLLGLSSVYLAISFGSQAYLIGLRKSENRWNREQVAGDLERLKAEMAAQH